MTSKSLQGQWQQGRTLLAALACLLAALALLPLGGLLGEGVRGLLQGKASLGADGLSQIRGTTLLLLGTASLGAVLGSANGWLLANCRFPGRRLLRIAQLPPLASPSYLLAATLVDLGSIHGIRIYGLGWGVLSAPHRSSAAFSARVTRQVPVHVCGPGPPMAVA